MKKHITTFLVLTLISACSLAPEYERPEVNMADNWKNNNATGPSPSATTLNKEWWKKFGNPELDKTISEALTNNQDIQASVQRIEQSRATAKAAGANLLPLVSASASAGRSGNYDIDNNNGLGLNRNSSSAQVSISYEVDLFGRNRASRDAAVTRLQATTYDHDALLLLISSDTATAFAQLLAYNDRIKFAQENLDNANKVLKIVQARFDNGVSSQLEVSQQKSTVYGFESNLIALKQQRDAIFTQTAILTGHMPEDFSLATNQTLSSLKTPIAASIQPSELLSRRPDIAAAEADIKAANMDIGIARAAFFPDLQLSLNSTINSISSPDTVASSLIASSVAPIFTGGTLKANLEYSEARKRELIAQYFQVILTSLKEVEDSYSALSSATSRVKLDALRETEAKRSNDIALERYKSGTTDFETLLNSQTSLLQAQDDLLLSRLDEITSSITLFKALGGGWQIPSNQIP